MGGPLKLIFLAITIGVMASGCRSVREGSDDASSIVSSESGAKDQANKDGNTKDSKIKGQKPRNAAVTVYAWNESQSVAWRYAGNKMSWEDAGEYCHQVSLSSKKRWRLPSPSEVQNAIKNGVSSSKNPSFGWVYLHQVWTSTWETPQGKKMAVYVDAGDASAFHTSVDHELSVLCVNTVAPNGRSDLWTDEKSNLIWRDLGEHVDRWSLESKCLDVARSEKLPWRVATASEIQSAVRNGIQSGANPAFGQNYITTAWTSDRASGFGQDGLAIDLRNGNRYVVSSDQLHAGLCVRPRYY
jgi:hypothetical protein